VRAAHGTQNIVGVAHVGDPIPDGLIHGIFQGAAAGFHRHYLRPQQTHADNVEALAPDVFGTHVDVAGKPQQGCHRGGSHPVLSRPGLGNQPGFAHAPGQQTLPQGVVDFVRPGVGQVLPLDIDLRPSQLRGEMPGEIQGRGAAHVILQVPGQLPPELLVAADPPIRRLQLQQGRHQGLRHKPAPIPPISAMPIR
jgi:hypothetical protein